MYQRSVGEANHLAVIASSKNTESVVFIKYTRQYQVADMRAKCSFMYFFYCHHCFLQDNIGNRTLCDISCESTRLGQFYTGKPTINKTRPRKHLSHSSLLIKRDYFLTHASCKSKNIWIRNQPLRYQSLLLQSYILRHLCHCI